MRGYTSRCRDSSYFGLFLAFGLLFLDDFGTMLCHVNGMEWIFSLFEGLLPKRIWVEKLHLREFPKCSYNPWTRYCVDWRNSVALCTPTLDDHIFLIRTLICLFLDSMKRSLSLESSHMLVIGI